MKVFLMGIGLCSLLLVACKKANNPTEEEEPNPNEVQYPGKISSYDGYEVFYNSDGLLTSYSYHDWQSANAKVTVTLNWENNTMTFHNTSVWGVSDIVYNRNALGYCLESPTDFYNHWEYDSLGRLETLNSISYYWTGENVDSIRYLGQTEIYEYNNILESRDMGRKFIPVLPMVNYFPSKNLRVKTTRLDSARDTVYVETYSYEFDSYNRVTKQTLVTFVDGVAQNTNVSLFSYYE